MPFLTKTYFKLLLFAAAITLIYNCCKKYEDDDKRYFKTPCGRIAKKWQLYKITDAQGRDYSDSLFYFTTPDNNYVIKPEQSYTYSGLILEFERSDNKRCLETGIRGKVNVLNKPFSSGTYEIRDKRTMLSFDVRPHTNTRARYFFGNYTIYKMTSDELVFGRDEARADFKVAD